MANYQGAFTGAEIDSLLGQVTKIYGETDELIGTSESHLDLDDYRTPGTFFCRNSTNAGYIDNIPVGGSGFRLIVEYVTTSSTTRQTFYKPTDASKIYVRTFSNNAWSGWYVFTGTVVS